MDSQSSVRCLFVGQREYATVSYQDPVIDIIGSDDATTCHIALLVDESNKLYTRMSILSIKSFLIL